MEYSSIEELPSSSEALKKLSSTELAALSRLWLKKKGKLENSEEYRDFLKKMQREWAIETGIIERLYHLDRGITETLIEQGIDASLISGTNRDEVEKVVKLIKDQEHTVEELFSFVKSEQPLSEQYIRAIHQQITTHQKSTEAMTPDGKLVQIPLIKGKYKEQSNNPKISGERIHKYCPPISVVGEMERLIKLYLDYEAKKVPPEILSAWLHHRFTQIHPFQDGNGRIARALASLVFIKCGLFPLVIRNSDRENYISALEAADNENFTPIVRLFSRRQRDSILSALGIQQQVEQAKHWQQVIKKTVNTLNKKSKAEKEQIQKIYNVAGKLQDIVEDKFTEVQKELERQLKSVETTGRESYKASTRKAKDGEIDSHYFKHQIIQMANKHRYYANTDYYKSWTRLTIQTTTIFETVFSIHGYGHPNNGVMVVSGFTFEKADSEEGVEKISTKPSNTDIFQFNYLESEEHIIKRFDEWLDESIMFSLAEWNKITT